MKLYMKGMVGNRLVKKSTFSGRCLDWIDKLSLAFEHLLDHV